MSFTVVQRGPETDAVLALLGGVVLTGDGVKPAGGGFANEDSTGDFTPYVVLYPTITPLIDGPVGDPFADTLAEYQVTAVGVTGVQARWGADKAKAALLAQTLAVAGRFVQLVEWTGGQATARDDDVTPPLFYCVDLYQIATSPA